MSPTRGSARGAVTLRRWLYRAAIPLMRVYWFLLRPHVTGVKFVLTDAGRVLLVCHTYGPRSWDVPGGWIRPREAPERAARREAEEELGLAIEDWRRVGIVRGRAQHRRDTLHCFTAAREARELHLDPGEIAEARWFAPDDLPAPLGRYVEEILALLAAP